MRKNVAEHEFWQAKCEQDSRVKEGMKNEMQRKGRAEKGGKTL